MKNYLGALGAMFGTGMFAITFLAGLLGKFPPLAAGAACLAAILITTLSARFIEE